MSNINANIKEQEIRFFGSCIWCGHDTTVIRDFMCYHAVNPCCHALYRYFPTKISIALRSFPHRRIKIDTQFEQFSEAFVNVVKKDNNKNRNIKEQIDKIIEYSDLKDFLSFLIRIYLIRKQVNVAYFEGDITNECIICGYKFSGPNMYCCSTCMTNMGVNIHVDDFNIDKPQDKKPPKPKHGGMHINKYKL